MAPSKQSHQPTGRL